MAPSGFALLVVLYYANPRAFPSSTPPSPTSRAAPGRRDQRSGLLVAAWLAYGNLAARGLLAGRGLVLAAAVRGARGAVSPPPGPPARSSAPRAAYLQVGAMIGTMMAGNVLFVIIPGQRELVRATREGRPPAPPARGYGGKERSVHNNYLVLPALFAMLAGHFPFTYTHDHAWAVLVALMAVGAAIRHYFNRRHAGRDALVDPGRLRLRDRRDRGLAPAARDDTARRRCATVSFAPGAADRRRRAARPATRCTRPSPGSTRRPPASRSTRLRRSTRSASHDQGGRGRLDVHAARRTPPT